MENNSKYKSPIDLGQLIIDGNSAVLSNRSQSSSEADPKAILTGLISQMSAKNNGPDNSNTNALPQVAIDAASKVQKDYYTKHAEDLVSSHPEGIAVLNQLIDTHNKSQSSASPTESSASPNEVNQFQQQAMNIVQPQGFHPLGAALNLLGNLTGMRAANQAISSVQLGNLEKAQKISGQEPLQVGDYQKLQLSAAKEMAKQGTLSANELMTKFENASQPFITQRDSYARIQSLANDPSPAGDLGLIFSYMKLLDPSSTVREGEQATAENARGVPDSIRNLYTKIISGKKLTPDQRNDFTKRSHGIFKSIESQQKKTTTEFARLGKMNGIDPEKFIRDTGLSESTKNTEKPKGNSSSGDVQVGRFQVRVK